VSSHPQHPAPQDVLRALRFALTEDDFPFFNRHPHHTTAETWAMWAERDVLALIDNTIAAYDRAAVAGGGEANT
jgi:hypothetical protein